MRRTTTWTIFIFLWLSLTPQTRWEIGGWGKIGSDASHDREDRSDKPTAGGSLYFPHWVIRIWPFWIPQTSFLPPPIRLHPPAPSCVCIFWLSPKTDVLGIPKEWRINVFSPILRSSCRRRLRVGIIARFTARPVR